MKTSRQRSNPDDHEDYKALPECEHSDFDFIECKRAKARTNLLEKGIDAPSPSSPRNFVVNVAGTSSPGTSNISRSVPVESNHTSKGLKSKAIICKAKANSKGLSKQAVDRPIHQRQSSGSSEIELTFNQDINSSLLSSGCRDTEEAVNNNKNYASPSPVRHIYAFPSPINGYTNYTSSSPIKNNTNYASASSVTCYTNYASQSQVNCNTNYASRSEVNCNTNYAQLSPGGGRGARRAPRTVYPPPVADYGMPDDEVTESSSSSSSGFDFGDLLGDDGERAAAPPADSDEGYPLLQPSFPVEETPSTLNNYLPVDFPTQEEVRVLDLQFQTQAIENWGRLVVSAYARMDHNNGDESDGGTPENWETAQDISDTNLVPRDISFDLENAVAEAFNTSYTPYTQPPTGLPVETVNQVVPTLSRDIDIPPIPSESNQSTDQPMAIQNNVDQVSQPIARANPETVNQTVVNQQIERVNYERAIQPIVSNDTLSQPIVIPNNEPIRHPARSVTYESISRPMNHLIVSQHGSSLSLNAATSPAASLNNITTSQRINDCPRGPRILANNESEPGGAAVERGASFTVATNRCVVEGNTAVTATHHLHLKTKDKPKPLSSGPPLPESIFGHLNRGLNGLSDVDKCNENKLCISASKDFETIDQSEGHELIMNNCERTEDEADELLDSVIKGSTDIGLGPTVTVEMEKMYYIPTDSQANSPRLSTTSIDSLQFMTNNNKCHSSSEGRETLVDSTQPFVDVQGIYVDQSEEIEKQSHSDDNNCKSNSDVLNKCPLIKFTEQQADLIICSKACPSQMRDDNVIDNKRQFDTSSQTAVVKEEMQSTHVNPIREDDARYFPNNFSFKLETITNVPDKLVKGDLQNEVSDGKIPIKDDIFKRKCDEKLITCNDVSCPSESLRDTVTQRLQLVETEIASRLKNQTVDSPTIYRSICFNSKDENSSAFDSTNTDELPVNSEDKWSCGVDQIEPLLNSHHSQEQELQNNDNLETELEKNDNRTSLDIIDGKSNNGSNKDVITERSYKDFVPTKGPRISHKNQSCTKSITEVIIRNICEHIEESVVLQNQQKPTKNRSSDEPKPQLTSSIVNERYKKGEFALDTDFITERMSKHNTNLQGKDFIKPKTSCLPESHDAPNTFRHLQEKVYNESSKDDKTNIETDFEINYKSKDTIETSYSSEIQVDRASNLLTTTLQTSQEHIGAIVALNKLPKIGKNIFENTTTERNVQETEREKCYSEMKGCKENIGLFDARLINKNENLDSTDNVNKINEASNVDDSLTRNKAEDLDREICNVIKQANNATLFDLEKNQTSKILSPDAQIGFENASLIKHSTCKNKQKSSNFSKKKMTKMCAIKSLPPLKSPIKCYGSYGNNVDKVLPIDHQDEQMHFKIVVDGRCPDNVATHHSESLFLPSTEDEVLASPRSPRREDRDEETSPARNVSPVSQLTELETNRDEFSSTLLNKNRRKNSVGKKGIRHETDSPLLRVASCESLVGGPVLKGRLEHIALQVDYESERNHNKVKYERDSRNEKHSRGESTERDWRYSKDGKVNRDWNKSGVSEPRPARQDQGEFLRRRPDWEDAGGPVSGGLRRLSLSGRGEEPHRCPPLCRTKLEPMKLCNLRQHKPIKCMTMAEFNRYQADKHKSEALHKINKPKLKVDCHLDPKIMDKSYRVNASCRKRMMEHNKVARENLKFLEKMQTPISEYNRQSHLSDFKKNYVTMVKQGRHSEAWAPARGVRTFQMRSKVEAPDELLNPEADSFASSRRKR